MLSRPGSPMNRRRLAPPVLALLVLASCGGGKDEPPAAPPPAARPPAGSGAAAGGGGAPAFVARAPEPGERHLKNLRQLTFGGENAEAYFSNAGDRLVFQATPRGAAADQIYVMPATGGTPRLVSTGKGRTTCSWFLPGDKRILFASTHRMGDAPPPPPDKSHGYAWGVFEYDLFTVNDDGTDLRPLVMGPGYDAEATVSRQGDRIVFTSSRDDDLELYTAAIDGSDVRRLTNEVGYDGGGVFSPDGRLIAWRASRPETEEAKKEFRTLLGKGIVRPNRLELFVMDADGRNPRQVTTLGKASFGPWFTPDGKRLIFSSNVDDPQSRSFDLYLVNLDGTGLERVTTFTTPDHDDFDGFPMFSPDGKRLVWCSNRHHEKPHETNVFIADWVD